MGALDALSGPVLRDTARLSQRYPPIARYGVLGVSTWRIGCDTPSPFSERFPLGEHAKWREKKGTYRSRREKKISGSLVTLENSFPPNYRYRYRLEIRMNSFNYHRLGIRSHPFISIASQLPS